MNNIDILFIFVLREGAGGQKEKHDEIRTLLDTCT